MPPFHSSIAVLSCVGHVTSTHLETNCDTDVFGTNRRLIMSIDSPEFGLVGFVAVRAVLTMNCVHQSHPTQVGATMVGSVVMTVVTGQSVAKGEEVIHGIACCSVKTIN